MYTKRIGEKIKKMRTEKSITQKELGSTLNYTESYISHLENGSRRLSIRDLRRVAKFFDVDYRLFFEDMPTMSHFRADLNSSEVECVDYDDMIKKFISYAKKNNN